MSSLYIFDFDDTLAMTDSHVRVISADGSVTRLNSREFAKYRHTDGDRLDFKEFNRASGSLIKSTVAEMESAISAHGLSNVYIVTARSDAAPVSEFLRSNNITVPTIVATAGSEGKARWLTGKLHRNNPTNIFVYEDCAKNISMLKEVVELYNEEYGTQVQYSAVCILPSGRQKVVEAALRKIVRNVILNC